MYLLAMTGILNHEVQILLAGKLHSFLDILNVAHPTE